MMKACATCEHLSAMDRCQRVYSRQYARLIQNPMVVVCDLWCSHQKRERAEAVNPRPVIGVCAESTTARSEQ